MGSEHDGKSGRRWVEGYMSAVTGGKKEGLGTHTAGFGQVDVGGEGIAVWGLQHAREGGRTTCECGRCLSGA